MNIVVTGGAGFIGRNIVEHFHSSANVTVLDNLRSGFQRNLEGLKCDPIVGSILDREVVRTAVAGADYVFHLAAMVSVPESLMKPEECAEINTTGSRIVLEESARAGVEKLIFSSSAAVYGDNPTNPKTEATAPEPKSPYAATKLEGEQMCAEFTKAGKLQTVVLRYFNVFGPYQNPRSQYAAAVPGFISRALTNEPLTIFGDGKQTRDFIFVNDVVGANSYFALQSEEVGVFNAAGGKGTSILELAHQIIRLTGSSSEIRFDDERPGDIKHSLAAVRRLSSTGFQPKWDLQSGLEKTIEFFRTSPNESCH